MGPGSQARVDRNQRSFRAFIEDQHAIDQGIRPYRVTTRMLRRVWVVRVQMVELRVLRNDVPALDGQRRPDALRDLTRPEKRLRPHIEDGRAAAFEPTITEHLEGGRPVIALISGPWRHQSANHAIVHPRRWVAEEFTAVGSSNGGQQLTSRVVGVRNDADGPRGFVHGLHATAHR